MNRAVLSFLAVLLSAAPALAAAADLPGPKPLNPSAKAARGHYLVATSGCHDCHTPFKPTADGGAEPDMARALSGHPADLLMPPAPALPPGPWLVSAAGTNTAWAGPWGVSFTANLTPDRETGLGKWSLQNFKDTIRTGRHLGRGRPILPPMPYPVYRNMTDEDLEAVFAYLKSIPPIRNQVPVPIAPPVAPVAATDAATLATAQ